MELGTNKNDGNEELGLKNKLDLSISNLSQGISEKVSVLSDKLLDLKLSKEAFNKTLLIILGSAIFAQPVKSGAVGFSWKVIGDVSNIEEFEICSSTNPNRYDISSWGDCEVKPIITIPPSCIEDPDDNAVYYEGGYDYNPLKSYIAIRVKDTSGLTSGFSEVIDMETLNSPYNRINIDYTRDGKKDIIDYKAKKLYIKDSKEGLFCISRGQGSRTKIIENYGSTGDEQLRILDYYDDNLPDIGLCDIDNKTCDVDLSNNGYGSIDLTDQPYNPGDMDSIFYNIDTGISNLGINNLGQSFNLKSFNWGTGKEVISLPIHGDKDRIFIYKSSSGGSYLARLKDDLSGFDSTSITLQKDMTLTSLGDLLGTGQGAFLGRSTVGGVSYVYFLNDVGDNIDHQLEIDISYDEQVTSGSFTLENKKSIVRYNKVTGKTTLFTPNSNGTSFEEKNFFLEPGKEIITTDLIKRGLDDIILNDKINGGLQINRLKENDNSFHKFDFPSLPSGFDLYSLNIGNNGKSILLGYNQSRSSSNACFLVPNKNGTGFIEPIQYFTWDTGLQISTGDVFGIGEDGIRLYKKSSGVSFFVKIDVDINGVVSLVANRYDVPSGTKEIIGNYDGE